MNYLLRKLVMTVTSLAVSWPAGAQTVGLLSMVKGDVQIVRAGKTAGEPARPADLLRAGDRVITSANGEATYLYCPGKKSGKLLPGGEAEFAVTALRIPRGKVGEERPVPCTLPASIAQAGPSGSKTGAPRFRGASIVLRAPTRSNVTSQRPTFRWDAVEHATRYEVKLTNREEQILLKRSTTSPELAFPVDTPLLEWGQKYQWRVTVFENNENLAESGSSFQLLPAALAKQVNETRSDLLEMSKASPDDSGPLFLLAFLYEENGIFDEAARVYAQLNNRMGEQDWVQSRLNELMGRLGWDRLESGAVK